MIYLERVCSLGGTVLCYFHVQIPGPLAVLLVLMVDLMVEGGMARGH